MVLTHLLLPLPLQAREIYEEGIQRVTTVRDFGQVFDAYAQFEESMINAKMETTAEMGPTEEGKGLSVLLDMWMSRDASVSLVSWVTQHPVC